MEMKIIQIIILQIQIQVELKVINQEEKIRKIKIIATLIIKIINQIIVVIIIQQMKINLQPHQQQQQQIIPHQIIPQTLPPHQIPQIPQQILSQTPILLPPQPQIFLIVK